MANGGWANIADDLIFLLAERVLGVTAFIRLSAVCKSWFSVASATKCCNPIPWLMLAEKEGSKLRDFYDHSSGELYQLYLPQTCGTRNIGSAHGWLITANEGGSFHLSNPISGTQIALPFTTNFPSEFMRDYWADEEKLRDNFIEKAACFEPNGDYIVAATHMGEDTTRLSYCRSTDKDWTTFDELLMTKDVGFVGNILLMSTDYGEIYSINFACSPLDPVKIVTLPEDEEVSCIECQCYFIECVGTIYVVKKKYTEFGEVIYTTSFEVFELHIKAKKITKVKSIGDYAFFVGKNNGICLPVTKGSKAFMKDCIYFVDDRSEQSCYSIECGEDMGIYNLNDGSIISHYPGRKTKSTFSTPMWVIIDLN